MSLRCLNCRAATSPLCVRDVARSARSGRQPPHERTAHFPWGTMTQTRSASEIRTTGFAASSTQEAHAGRAAFSSRAAPRGTPRD